MVYEMVLGERRNDWRQLVVINLFNHFVLLNLLFTHLSVGRVSWLDLIE
jgi:hypothetical protein